MGNRIWVAIACMCILTLTGCSGQESGAESGHSSGGEMYSSEVVQDRLRWALPSDTYSAPPFSLRYYAVGLEASACIEETGYPFVVRRYDINAPLPVTNNAVGRKLFDEKIAGEYGYHEQMNPRINWADQKASRELTFSLSDEAWDMIGNCLTEAEVRLGIDPEAVTYGGFPIDDVASVDSVREATGRWLECMAPLGIADLAPGDDPYSMPTGSLTNKWGLNQDVPEWELDPATVDEIEVAVADAKCRESSGWAEARYQAEWSAEEEFLEKHRKEFEAMRAQYEIQEKNFLAVIAKAGK